MEILSEKGKAAAKERAKEERAATATPAGRPDTPPDCYEQDAYGIRYIKGNMFERLPQCSLVIPHVCNDLGAWGSGFVIPLARHFPEARSRYVRAFSRRSEEREMARIGLGWTQIVEFRDPARCQKVEAAGTEAAGTEAKYQDVWVCNMVAQHGCGCDETGRPPIRYSVLAHCMKSVAILALAEQAEIHAPKFGAGLAGGNWDFIVQLIREIWVDRGLKVTVYYLD